MTTTSFHVANALHGRQGERRVRGDVLSILSCTPAELVVVVQQLERARHRESMLAPLVKLILELLVATTGTRNQNKHSPTADVID